MIESCNSNGIYLQTEASNQDADTYGSVNLSNRTSDLDIQISPIVYEWLDVRGNTNMK